MNMLQENYKQELSQRIKETSDEISLLKNDYNSVVDEVCKSQIKTFLEKKQLLLLDLYKQYEVI